jgi:hypothetical protein
MKKPGVEDYVRRMNRHFYYPALDPEFAATYGYSLATLRARFLRDAHPAWGVFGNWLRPTIGCGNTCQTVFVPLLLAGVFFSDYDAFQGVLEEFLVMDSTPNLLMLMMILCEDPDMTTIKSLYIDPHFHRIKKALYREFQKYGALVACDLLTVIPNKRREHQVLDDMSFAIPRMCAPALRILHGLGGSS